MKHVWKCDYCSETGEEEKIGKHEKACLLNPTNKSCYTCKHRNYLYGVATCALQRHMFANDDGNNCDGWFLEK